MSKLETKRKIMLKTKGLKDLLKASQELLDENKENDIDAEVIADYVDSNWEEITGLEEVDKDEEGHFPEEVQELLGVFNIDYCDFSNAWGSMRG